MPLVLFLGLQDDEDFDVEKVVPPVSGIDGDEKKKWDDEPAETFEQIAAREAKEAAEKAAAVPKNPNAGKPKESKKKLEPEKEVELSKEEALLESRKREQLVKESDFKNALDLFGADTVAVKKPVATGDLMTMEPSTNAEFTKFSQLLSDRAKSFSEDSHYPHLVKEIVKSLSDPLSVDDVRDLVKILNLTVNEKIKSAKGGKGKPAAKKPVAKLNVKGGANEENFEDHISDKYDDIADDFM